MGTYYQDNHISIYNKDCRDMSELPDNSVQCVVTSPPYWGLRKYSGEQDLIWGDDHCDHQWDLADKQTGQKHWNQGGQVISNAERVIRNGGIIKTGFCSLCGAWKGAFGLEPTPEMYIQHTFEILREIWRVLRKDGVVFWNIGDSYAGSNCGSNDYREKTGLGAKPTDRYKGQKPGLPKGMKPKDLCLIPFRLAIACQEDGWWVRSVIIWSKPNPMPESVTDRPTGSHEYILMLTKDKTYYWDAVAVMEPISESWADDKRPHGVLRQRFYPNSKYVKAGMMEAGEGLFPTGERATDRNIHTVWEFPTQPFSDWEGYDWNEPDFIIDNIPYKKSNTCPVHGDDDHRGKSISGFIDTSGVCTCRPAEISHFAVFPEKLPEICIKASTPEVGCCSKCGAPWERIINERSIPTRNISGNYKTRDPARHIKQSDTIGWRPTCKCNSLKAPVPSLVLDPFVGTGTTLRVAKKLGRRAAGYDISVEYCRLALERNRQLALWGGDY